VSPTPDDAPPAAPGLSPRDLDLAVQNPRNRTKSTVQLARQLGVDPALIQGRRDDTIRISHRWPDGAAVVPPLRLREILGGA
jgi:hypothetical protein